MYDVACSRVGHIYRGGGIPQPTGRKGDFLHKVQMTRKILYQILSNTLFKYVSKRLLSVELQARS